MFVGGSWREYLHVGLRVAAAGKGRESWKFGKAEGRGGAGRRPLGSSGSVALLRVLESRQAVRFPY